MSDQPNMDEMNEQMRDAFAQEAEKHNKDVEMLKGLVAAANVDAVFAEPVQSGEYLVINASENVMGVGYGRGFGGGSGSMKDEETEEETPVGGFGGGTGGGGGSTTRPVAAIIIGPEGVRVEPIVDVTKFMIALFTTVGSMALMFSRMKKQSKG